MAGELKLRVISRRAPDRVEGRATEFGLQDKKKVLRPGEPFGDGQLVFDVDVGVELELGAEPRFRGPLVHGKSGAYHLYIGWRHAGADVWINRLKVALAMPVDQVTRAIEADHRLETDATGPAWGQLKDWHGLNIGRIWTG